MRSHTRLLIIRSYRMRGLQSIAEMLSSADCTFHDGRATRCAIDETKNRPIEVDRRWNVVESESRHCLLKNGVKNIAGSRCTIKKVVPKI